MPAFKMSKNEITFELYDLFVKQAGYKSPDDENWGRQNRPVINVSWHDAILFIDWLNKVLKPKKLYRLPSEAEWEYASRAGSKTKYWWGNKVGSNKANCDNCDSQWDNTKTAPVNSFNHNLFSLNDTLGNVYEWVEDCWNNTYKNAPEDGSAMLSGDCKFRVVRGGSWRDCPNSMRSAYRSYYPSEQRYNEVGFRIAQSI
ncbi:MAG: formylglycine-generating enzyme family protein [Gammaproteobacteria bacterium]|nr:formylglycine-generating enzyme family protein [Gammaproteobacteria bacterium]